MVFALLGMDTLERQNSYKYVVTKAKEARMDIRVFDHNIEEVRGIIFRAAKWVNNGHYDSSKANKVAEFLHDSCMDEIAINEYADSIEEELNALGIIVDNSSYLAEEDGFQLDEKKLIEAIKNEYGKRAIKYRTEEMYENSILVDVRSLVMIHRKRAGGYSTDLKNCRYLFVTTNGAIAKVSKDIASENEIEKDKIPSCVTVDLLGTLLWMDSSDNSEGYLSLKLIADCKSLLKPTQEMIARFNMQLDNAFKRGDLTEERFLFLRSHPIVRDKLLDATSGDYASFTDNTWREVYSMIEAHAQFEADKKYELEKESHEQTKNELIAAKDTIIDKEEEIAKKESVIENQQDVFSSVLAKVLTILIFGIPYLAILLFIIFVQNTYFNWTWKGILLGVITILLGVLAKLVFQNIYKTVRNRIKKWIAKKANTDI